MSQLRAHVGRWVRNAWQEAKICCALYGRAESAISWHDGQLPVASVEGWRAEAKRGIRDLDSHLGQLTSNSVSAYDEF